MTTRTIRVIDVETTGKEPPEAEVCEIGWCDLRKSEDRIHITDPESVLCAVRCMPPDVRGIHHITMEDVANCMPFDAEEFLRQSSMVTAFAAHNAAFEAKFIGETQTPMICTMKVAMRLWPEAPDFKNGTLRYWLQDQGRIHLEHEKTQPAHRAGPDAYTTAHILKAALELATVTQMVRWTREPPLMPRCPIGKERGKAWKDVDAGFLNWMISQKDMEADLKWNAQREIDRRRGGRPDQQ